MPGWLLVLFRLTGIFVLAPVLGSRAIPRHVKVFLAIGLSLLVYPVLLNPSRPAFASIASVTAGGMDLMSLGPMIAAELLIGFAVGYAATLPLIGMQIGGHVIDQQLGLGLAGVINPELGEQSGVTAEFFFVTSVAIFAILDGHHEMLRVLVASFDHVPMGGFDSVAGLAELAVGLVAVSFELALRVAAPLLCLMFLVMVGMGFIARTVPQMNILSVGFALRIVVGLIVIAASVAAAFGAFEQVLMETFDGLNELLAPPPIPPPR